MGQTKTLAIERILKDFFDAHGVPEIVADSGEKDEG